ncbi:MAG: hypothetical protein LBQ50_13070 [Planctomycetaceae bacterium]|jgi:primosomal protein N''|nr:hypothetical protein [Planctomycetaceae bacterium]
MEELSYEIEELDGQITETQNTAVAQNAFDEGLHVTFVRTFTTYTKNAKIVLRTYEDKIN